MVNTPPQTDTYSTALDIFDRTHPLRVDVDENLKVTGTFTTVPSGTQTVAIDQTGTHNQVDVVNFPATQPISGAVSVSNFPASQAVTGTFWQTTQPVSESNIDKSYGTWIYYAGTSGTVTVSAGQRITGITAHCTTAGSLTINGGATITIPINTSFTTNPLGNLVAPTVVFTGTDAYFIEAVS